MENSYFDISFRQRLAELKQNVGFMIEGSGLNYLSKFEGHGTLNTVAMANFGIEAPPLTNVWKTHISISRSGKDLRSDHPLNIKTNQVCTQWNMYRFVSSICTNYIIHNIVWIFIMVCIIKVHETLVQYKMKWGRRGSYAYEEVNMTRSAPEQIVHETL